MDEEVLKSKYDPVKNNEQNFFVVRQGIIKEAKERQIPVTKIIDEYIDGSHDFISADGGNLSDGFFKDLKKYLYKMKKFYTEQENVEKKKNKKQKLELEWKEIESKIDDALNQGNGTKKEIIEKIIIDLSEGNWAQDVSSKNKKFVLKKLNEKLDKLNKDEQTKAKNVEKAMQQIQKIVNREFELGNIKNKASYLSMIRDSIIGENTGIDLNIKIGKEEKEHLIEILDCRIKTEREELYFEQVKNFTNNFQFLRSYSEIEDAENGTSKRVKFTDYESYNKFCDLRELLQKEYNEDVGIQLLMKSNEIDDMDKRVLAARKNVIDKENERNRKIQEEGIR